MAHLVQQSSPESITLANIKSAQKRNRQRLRRRERNQSHLSSMRTFVKRVRTAIDTKEVVKGAAPKIDAADALAKAISKIDRAAQKGVIARKAASRKISRLTLAVGKAKAAKA